MKLEHSRRLIQVKTGNQGLPLVILLVSPLSNFWILESCYFGLNLGLC